MKKNCPICKTKFSRNSIWSYEYWKTRIYCSNRCRLKSLKGKPLLSLRKRLKRVCVVCNKEFNITPSVLRHNPNHGRFCSKECSNSFQRGKSSKGKPFEKGHIPWNKDKHGLVPKERHSRWRGGITSLYDQIRNCYQYNEWRTSIFLRDKFICQICKKYSKQDCNADHYPKSFAQIIDENKIKTFEQALLCSELWDIKNGRTLCKDCHEKTDTYMKALIFHPTHRNPKL